MPGQPTAWPTGPDQPVAARPRLNPLPATTAAKPVTPSQEKALDSNTNVQSEPLQTPPPTDEQRTSSKETETSGSETDAQKPSNEKPTEQQAEQQSLAIVQALREFQQTEPVSPLFSITQGSVSYAGETLFSGLDWQIQRGEHWQVRGPNGCGKSTLLNLIFGDHPPCYSNQIEVMGFRRGSGESIWQVKQHIGMVSAALHLQYRVNCSALEVVLSGLYDSIGVYQQASELELEQARLWLQLFGLANLEKHYFKSLSYGQQRLLIIARALVKGPQLLLLDEPCQGLDFLQRNTVLKALELVAKHNLSQLVYVTHHQDDALPSIKHFIDFADGAVQLSKL